MDRLKIKRIINGAEEANCYLLVLGNDLAVVDPGDRVERIISAIEEFGTLNYRYIFLTHGHFDHVGAVKKLVEKYGFRVAISDRDKDIKYLNEKFGLKLPGMQFDIFVHDGDILNFGGGKVKILATPGHTSGSVCYLIGDNLFSGDTLFPHRHGRTDFATGNPEEMSESLAKLFKLPDETKVFPGHYEETTIGEARKYFK